MQITKVFNYLNENKIQYSIIEINELKKNIKNPKGEVDLVIENCKNFKLLLTYLNQENWIKTYEFSKENCNRIQFIKRDFINGFFYKLDIFNSFFHEYKDKLYSLECKKSKPTEIIEDRIYLKGNNLYLIYLLKILVEKRKGKIEKLIEFSGENFIFKKELVKLKLKNSIENFDFFLDKLISLELVNKVKFHNYFINIKSIINIINRYVLVKNIPMIAFIGLDGAGKSTIISKISKNLIDQDFSCEIVYLGHRSYHIKLLKKIKDKKSKSLIDNLLYVFLWPIEVRIRVAKAIRISNFILFDRHPKYEPVVPKGNKYMILNLLYKILARIFIPNPNYNFLLTGNDKILWERKKETSFDNYQKRVLELKELVKKTNIRTIIVKTDTNIEESLNYIKEKIIEYSKNIT